MIEITGIPTTKELYENGSSLAYNYVVSFKYPWEALSGIGDEIMRIGYALSSERFYQLDNCVWIAKNASVANTASISGPCIIDENAEIRHCAFIRGKAIVGKSAVVGNSTELKNCILFDEVQVPHYNYVGDSILGYKSHMGAGTITSNVKSDRSLVTVKNGEERIETGLKKCGAFLGNFVEIGCGAVLNPGTVIGGGAIVYPLSSVRGCVPENGIYKAEGKIFLRNI